MSDRSRILLVTGASGGIGRAVSMLAAQRGYTVAVHYHRDEAGAADLVGKIEEDGGSAAAFQADIGTEDAVCGLFRAIDDRLGTVRYLVNNAGILGEFTRVDEVSESRIERLFRVNVYGSIYCTRQAIHRMSTRYGGEGGAIVNVSSRAAVFGSPNEFVDYAATKGAIDTFTVGVAKEIAEEGVRVNAVRPGLIDTAMHAQTGSPNRANDLKQAIPIKRPGEAEEVARAVLWLLSDEASYVTGALLDVGGGR